MLCFSKAAVFLTFDSTRLGFQDSHIRLWSLTPRSLRSVKSAKELNLIDKESDDVFERMMEDCTGSESR